MSTPKIARRCVALLCGALLLAGCGQGWDEEIVLQIFKLKEKDLGQVTIKASQGGVQQSTTVNGDNRFFSSCESNKVVILLEEKDGSHAPVNVTITSAKYPKITATATVNVPVTEAANPKLSLGQDSAVQILVGTSSNYEPADCAPNNPPKLKATGEPCDNDAECLGGRCLKRWLDNKYVDFPGGYCTTNCLKDATACGAKTCTATPGKETDCCYKADTHMADEDAACLKRCSSGGCRAGYDCTPTGHVCLPTK